MFELYEDERIDFIGKEELQIIQSHRVFSFSLDAILLANFVHVPIQKGNLLDLCTGNGVIPLLLSQRSKANITGIEIQERLYEMARRSTAMNHMEERIEFMRADINDAPKLLKGKKFDVVTCNPPYFNTAAKDLINVNEHLAIARHEIYCSLEDVVRVSAHLVKHGGKAAFVHRPNRLLEIVNFMRAYHIEPKRLQFIHPVEGKAANMLLIEGTKKGKPDLKILPPIMIHTKEGHYTEEMKRILYGK
ncbi:tRNA1(Val) (adenine(37)-N6)-methyltransferase [Bacillus taeanensis]|uniref:SAM-dependent methyltransferase n=1 Tax=Bacillus taeanensis TaxID=273032 RepID=A0A366XU04_9BACI|nr:tRNA1(Val) (adenine(37)-N6)-methyltransferase [Bacillus taeanensis]RBW67624.1 SAM-dependent methyltransferase [Bacillus taeanensis]